MLTVTRTSDGFSLKGKLDETVTASSLREEINDATPLPAYLEFDLSELRTGNSSGLLHFIAFLKTFPAEVGLSRIPIWVVWQFNMISEFLPSNVTVVTFEAEYLNIETGTGKIFLLRPGHDVPWAESFADYSPPDREENGQIFMPDFDESYLTFITSLTAKRKGPQS